MGSPTLIVGYTSDEQASDKHLCLATLDELRKLDKRSREVAKLAKHPACIITLQTVHLFLEGAISALQRYLRLTGRPELRVPPDEVEAEVRQEWRPGGEPRVP